MYWEARNQSVEGMIAVGSVTRNRVHDKHFPNNYCDVVYQAKLSKISRWSQFPSIVIERKF